MGAEENKKLVQDIFEQMAKGNGHAFTMAMADDIRWTVPGSCSWAGTYESKADVVHKLLAPLLGQFAEYHSEVDQVLADGDHVVVQSRSHARTKRGDEYNQSYCYVFRVADGMLAEVVEYCDTAHAEQVLEHPAS
ncbi:nuclear transport factor 2 family protein [Actinocrispum wychmicini]|uniref:SnoaL-like domain-containing protein n=1 Tax=Actinocrispum wychmicini TaxID=1213861 RepID=A0A4R2JML3_9PSEU|nr:nuclear transport factor 2 family protein [Actinocrispum wychmicini]TCO60524.1 hypothetical protein EV192_10399 [Actinocrispum wychmicini]